MAHTGTMLTQAGGLKASANATFAGVQCLKCCIGYMIFLQAWVCPLIGRSAGVHCRSHGTDETKIEHCQMFHVLACILYLIACYMSRPIQKAGAELRDRVSL